MIHTSLGSEEELVCQVSALPLATVSWQKDGKSLDRSTPGVLIHQGYSRHSLAVLDIIEASQGLYECVATNTQGQARMGIRLTGGGRVSKLSFHLLFLSRSCKGSNNPEPP